MDVQNNRSKLRAYSGFELGFFLLHNTGTLRHGYVVWSSVCVLILKLTFIKWIYSTSYLCFFLPSLPFFLCSVSKILSFRLPHSFSFIFSLFSLLPHSAFHISLFLSFLFFLCLGGGEGAGVFSFHIGGEMTADSVWILSSFMGSPVRCRLCVCAEMWKDFHRFREGAFAKRAKMSDTRQNFHQI